MAHDVELLLEGLASADPRVRDGSAYEQLAGGIAEGRFESDLELIRATAVARLSSEEIQARTFAPLILTWLVQAGDRDRGAFDAVATWYPAETDTRAFDPRLGWLHGVAHGADYLGACAATEIATGPEVLDLLARRVVAPTDAWRDQEDARVAAAAAQALSHCDAGSCAAWLTILHEALSEFEETASSGDGGGRPPGWLHNVSSTCSVLYVALAEQPRDGDVALDIPHGDVVRRGLAEVLARMTPWLLSSRAVSTPSTA